MFNSLLKKIRNASLKDNYSISRLIRNDKAYLLRFKKSLWEIAGSTNYPFQVGIATKLKSDVNGFPSAIENNVLHDIEDLIINTSQQNNSFLYVGTITGGGMKEFILYTSNTEGVKKNFG